MSCEVPATDAGVKTLVLLPGMDGSGDLFSRFVRALGPGIDACVLRYPTQAPMGYAELAAWVHERLPANRPYALLAESFSGPIGIELAAQSPTMLKGLVLCCTFASNPRPAMRLLSPMLGAMPLAALPVGPLGRVLMGRLFEQALQADLSAAISPLSTPVMRARLQAVLTVDMTVRLRDLRLPVLDLRAGDDAVVPRSAARLLQRFKPDAECVELAGPHFLLQTRPAEAAEVVKRFMARLIGL